MKSKNSCGRVVRAIKSSSNDAWGVMKTGFSDAYSAVNGA